MLRQNPISLNPTRFYALVDIMGRVDVQPFDAYLERLGKQYSDVQAEVRELARANEAIAVESRRLTRKAPNPFDNLEKEGDEDPLKNFQHSVSGNNFITVVFEVVSALMDGYKHIQTAAQGFRPAPVAIGKRVSDIPRTAEDIQILGFQVSMNEAAINAFIDGVLRAEKAPNRIVDLGRSVVNRLDHYYTALNHRHSTEGVQIHNDPISTDIAISIFENVDSNGEIADGTPVDEVSAYSMRKAALIADSIRVGLVGNFIQNPDLFIGFIEMQLRELWTQANTLSKLAQPIATQVRQILGQSWDKPYVMTDQAFSNALTYIKDLDPRNVLYKEKTGLLTAEERQEMDFRNETLKNIADLLSSVCTTDELIQYVLERKRELREYTLEENSFFVCKIGAGNPFLGEAPGALSVVPGNKPTVNLNEVVGSGFDEVRSFIGHVTEGAKWHDLFLATSPSKKADKSNVLLVGPQGCGKTEVLRAVASDRKSLGIFAQSSDFLTCWKGEAEKNPKRLFEEGLRLQKESKKQVFFLIDEIDTILNGDRGHAAFGGTNLATEFQVLMDGISTYPNIALWGATNHPERIPMPLIRRFAKVVVVGELTQADRVKLLKQFAGYLPISGSFQDAAWEAAGQKLEGAVGDILRKVADHRVA